MNKYMLRIELLSDLCVSDGGIYNSTIDTDICHDRYGFPYIPAKRIKGCLRECGQELADWDDNPNSFRKALNTLFGEPGGRNGKANCRIGNAYLEEYEKLVGYIKANESHLFTHPETVLSKYAYVRTQTALDYDTGVADDNSLRTIRVAKKGLVFISSVVVENEESDKDLLESCCKIFRHMGIARTRGLGDVKVSLENVDENKVLNDPNKVSLNCPDYILNYTIELLEPMICKSINAGEAETQDYIEGSKVLGLIAGLLKDDGRTYSDFLKEGELIFSNAYLSIQGKRSFEVPAYYYNIKDDKKKYINKVYEVNETKTDKDLLNGKQLNQTKHGYMIIEDSKIVKRDVEVENHYHHRRPEDKSIGRAISKNGGEESDFYQMSSISAFQTFSGFIRGTASQLAEIQKLLATNEEVYLGYSSNTEYGKARIRVSAFRREPVNERETTKFSVRLNSPCIVYSSNAMVSTDANELEKEILFALNLSDKISDEKKEYKTDRFIRYTTIGGYNVTWNRRKPTIQTFDKGTAFLFDFGKTEVKIKSPTTIFIGERTMEGYGELYIEPVLENGRYIWDTPGRDEAKSENALLMTQENKLFFEDVADDFINSFIKCKAIKCANGYEFRSSMKSTISNILLLIEESDTFEEIKNGVEKRFDKSAGTKEEKYEEAKKFIKKTEEDTENILAEFEKEYNVSFYEPDIDIQLLYIKTFLTHGKYRLREDKE